MFWNFSKNDAIAAASVSEETRELHVSIEDGGSNPEAVQLNQKGMYLVKGNDYKATFKARAEEPRTIQVALLDKDGTVYYSGMKTIELTSEMEEKTFAFTMPKEVSEETLKLTDQMQPFTYEFNMPKDDIASFKMLLGKHALSPIGSHDVFIDNVVLKVKDAPSQQEPDR